ncbi:MAG: SURF1 family protein [Porticoccaceae bacterium]|nr:SURF1 family protein [Porticoccaceae bacterium]
MAAVMQHRVSFQWQINIAMLIFAAIFLPLTISLGFWQLQRAEEKQALLAEYGARKTAAPAAVASLDPSEDHQYRRVKVRGHLINDRTLLLENRVRNGQPGFEVITPVEIDPQQPWIWVNRGWIAGSLHRAELPQIPPVKGGLVLHGHLYRALDKPFTVGEEVWRERWPQVLQNFDDALLAERLGKTFFPYTLRLDQDSPAALATGWDIVNLIPEKHKGYAVQWFAMAVALVILSLFANSNLGAVIKNAGSKKTLD